MATLTRTQNGNWKALIRRRGWPATIRTFRTKRDAEDWARTVEDEIVRGVFVRRSEHERVTISEALDRYLREVTPTKRASTQTAEAKKAKTLREHLGAYSLAVLTPTLVARYRDKRLDAGKSNNSVRLELALLSHLYTTAIREWGMGLSSNPVANIRKPSPGSCRDRRFAPDEEERLMEVLDARSNPMLAWIVRIALETAMRQG
ncbi:MAG: site-specific integrase, partial [Chromatiales bacterium]|nr:site-specific integrase [Chromatiales bacterium]